MAGVVRISTHFLLIFFCVRCVKAVEYITFRWYGYHERFAMTTGWPQIATEVCQDFPAVCVSLALNRCVRAPATMGVPYTLNTTSSETANYVYIPPRDNLAAEYMLLAWGKLGGQDVLNIYSGCSSSCQDCAAGQALSLTPIQLPSMCGVTAHQNVYGLLYNSGDGRVNTAFNCVENLDDYWAQASANDLFATIMRISISGLIVLVIITLGSFLYLRICRQESSPYGLGLGNRVEVVTGTAQDAPTEEQIKACLPEVQMDKEETCAVCLEAIEKDHVARQLHCKHAFHSDCIVTWCAHRAVRLGQRHVICPVRRDQQPLFRSEGRNPPQVIGNVEGGEANPENV